MSGVAVSSQDLFRLCQTGSPAETTPPSGPSAQERTSKTELILDGLLLGRLTKVYEAC